MDCGLTNQRIVIVGGSSGTGLATARAAAAAGAAVTIAWSDQGRLDTALAGLPGNCDGAVVDTRSGAAVAALFAGRASWTTWCTPRLTRLLSGRCRTSRSMRPGNCSRSASGEQSPQSSSAPRLRPGGSIVLTSGTIGVRPTPGAALAASSAGAIEGLTRGLGALGLPGALGRLGHGARRTVAEKFMSPLRVMSWPAEPEKENGRAASVCVHCIAARLGPGEAPAAWQPPGPAHILRRHRAHGRDQPQHAGPGSGDAKLGVGQAGRILRVRRVQEHRQVPPVGREGALGERAAIGEAVATRGRTVTLARVSVLVMPSWQRRRQSLLHARRL